VKDVIHALLSAAERLYGKYDITTIPAIYTRTKRRSSTTWARGGDFLVDIAGAAVARDESLVQPCESSEPPRGRALQMTGDVVVPFIVVEDLDVGMRPTVANESEEYGKLGGLDCHLSCRVLYGYT